jgi:hypothetical protein
MKNQRTHLTKLRRPLTRLSWVGTFAAVTILTTVSDRSLLLRSQSQPAQLASAMIDSPKANPQDPVDTKFLEAPQPDAPTSEQEKQLARDSARLLTLARDLKNAVDKSDKDMLSLSVVRRADEIEHLAHNLRSHTATSGEDQQGGK